MIIRKMLRTDLPPVINYPDGSCNSVLACWKRNYANTIASRWTVSNTHFYCYNVGMFEGWVELEELPSSSFPENVVEVIDEEAVETY